MSYATRHMNPSKHLVGVTAVILLHVAIAYALMTGLARKVVDVVRAPIETKIIEDIKKKAPEPDKPPPPPPKLAPPPPPFIPPPEVNIALPAAAPVNAITAVTTTPPKAPAAPVGPKHEAVRVGASKDPSFKYEDPEYPPASRRMDEEGVVKMRCLVDVDGRVIDCKIESSSGFDRLDKAAVTQVNKYRFKPATLDGKPVQDWLSIPIRFRLLE